MRKLTEEAHQELLELLLHPGYRALVQEVENLTESIEADTLRYSLTSGAEGLVHTKARAEGARKLATLLRGKLDAIRAERPLK